ncbi:unnamed protein product, partial [Ectocarpus fasciculatus]
MKLLLVSLLLVSSNYILSGQSLGVRGGYTKYSTSQIPSATGNTIEAYLVFDSITPYSEIMLSYGHSNLQGYSDWFKSEVDISTRNIQCAWQRITPIKDKFQILVGGSFNYLITFIQYAHSRGVSENLKHHIGPGLYTGLCYGKTAGLPFGIELTAGSMIFYPDDWEDPLPYVLNVQLGITYSLYKK